ncbi:hypothetical protein [Sorangium atrum]|uniref:Uncharacterized protein n=1 Tax=Sorangium atrum TaxID=2995308 RepID=A0ABT5CGQ9_9BACT|nr:hypothetical protein [Sorangium aterium]MDC0685625.1 hypothetical protein [Sorangium aterium]
MARLSIGLFDGGREGGVFIAVAVVVEIAAVLAVALSRDRSCREAAWSNGQTPGVGSSP